jgi:hypothetical protein
MISNLTQLQLEAAHWLATEHESGHLPETFAVRWKQKGSQKVAVIEDFKGPQMELSYAVLQVLEDEQLLHTVQADIHQPLNFPTSSQFKKGGRPAFQYAVDKYEAGRTYILRNEIFRAKHLFEIRRLKQQAESVLRFMVTRPPGMQFATRPEIVTGLEMSDSDYERACQLLEDYDLIGYRSSVGMLWGDIQPTKKGRQVLTEDSLESLLQSQPPVVNYTAGDHITVTNTGVNAAIAAGRDSSASIGLTASQVHGLFKAVFDRLEELELTKAERDEATEIVELVEAEVVKGEGANEKALRNQLRNLGRMAPDILDVVIATAANPGLGAVTILRKVAEKAKSEAESRRD